MREMKDSGIEWIGDIPDTWTIKRMLYCLDSVVDYRGKTPEKVDEGILLVTAKNIKDGKIDYEISREYVREELYDEIMHRGKLKIGDVLFTTEAPLGEVANVDSTDFALAQRVIKFRADDTKLDNYYLKYCLMAPNTQQFLQMLSSGSTATGIKASKLPLIKIPLPDIDTQRKITSFLNDVCLNIDRTASDIQHQIELLQEYKQSVITEAVTKGMDKNVAMKDCGVEWIGKISSKANIIRLKHFSYMKGRIGWQGLKSTDFIDEGPYCITGTDFINGQVNWDTCYHVSEERYQMDPYIQIKIGDLLVTKDGTIGKMAIISKLPNKACLNSHLLIVRPLNNKFTNKYLYYVMLSDIFSHYYSLVSNGSTMDSLSQEKMGNFSFPIYNIDIQHIITDYLDRKCAEIDAVLADKQKQLDTLTEYKKSLIYEYVTGKKEVPADA